MITCFKVFHIFMLCVCEIQSALNAYRLTSSEIKSARNFEKLVIRGSKYARKI